MDAPPTQVLEWLYLGSEFNAASRLQLIERNVSAIRAALHHHFRCILSPAQ